MREVDEQGNVWEVNGNVRLLVEPTEEWIAENQPVVDPPVVTEPIDEEKAAMAEAIIDMDARITEMEAKVNA